MARYIDADAFKKVVGTDTKLRRTICEIIDKQPTAFNMDAVVADIEDFREEAEQFGFASALSDIVEVVRNGGVHE